MESQSRAKLIWITPEAEKLIGYMARVSNPENQDNPDVSKLISYCIKNSHWSIFEMANMCVEINTNRGISPQILRHKSFSFQEFCVAGDTKVDCIEYTKNDIELLERKELEIEKIYKKFHEEKNNFGIRTFDTKTGHFIYSNLNNVFYNGKKDVFDVTLEGGFKIKCTKEHKFYSSNFKFETLEDICGIVERNNEWLFTKHSFVFIDNKNFASYHGYKNNLANYSFDNENEFPINLKKIIEVKYIGSMDVYDLEVGHESHNYVANGILVHNSQRYAKVQGFDEIQVRRQDSQNRQNSIDDLDEETKSWWDENYYKLVQLSNDLYEGALERGIAKECARFALPLSTKTRMYMNGTIRSWIHFLNLRTGNGTQLEHQIIAEEIREIFKDYLPEVSKALGWV